LRRRRGFHDRCRLRRGLLGFGYASAEKSKRGDDENELLGFHFPPRFCVLNRGRFKHKERAADKRFLEGKPMLA